MPCRDGNEDGSYTIADLRYRNDELTRMLCSLIKAIGRSKKSDIDIPNDVAKWFIAHSEFDKKEGRY